MNFRSKFELDENILYMNSGTHSICPTEVMEAQFRYQKLYELNPTFGLNNAWKDLWTVQQDLAAFFHADPQDLFLRSNVTEALNEFILNVPGIPSGSEILTSDIEYHAIVNICHLKAKNEELSVRSLHVPVFGAELKALSSAALVDHVVSQLRPETKMLLLSHVSTGNGLILPLKEIAKETRKRGILLVADGAHAPGCFPLDFREWEDVDFYAGSLHKWMMGPKGTSFGWVPKRHQGTLQAVHAGWTTFEIPPQFEAFGNHNAFTARFLMASCYNFAPFFALKETLQFWRSYGDLILERILKLQTLLEVEMQREFGWQRSATAGSELHGPLLSYLLPEKFKGHGLKFRDYLYKEYKLQVAVPHVQGYDLLRLSPHCYNTEDEIVRAVKVLGNAVRAFLP